MSLINLEIKGIYNINAGSSISLSYCYSQLIIHRFRNLFWNYPPSLVGRLFLLKYILKILGLILVFWPNFVASPPTKLLFRFFFLLFLQLALIWNFRSKFRWSMIAFCRSLGSNLLPTPFEVPDWRTDELLFNWSSSTPSSADHHHHHQPDRRQQRSQLVFLPTLL